MLLQTTAILPGLLLPVLFLPRHWTPDNGFTLDARQIQSPESGLVVVELVLSYQGERPVEVEASYLEHLQARCLDPQFAEDAADGMACINIRAPTTWHRQNPPEGGTMNGLAPFRRKRIVKQGDRFWTIVALDRWFKLFPPGKPSLRFTWHVYGPPPSAEVFASPEATIAVDVPPNEPGNNAVQEKTGTLIFFEFLVSAFSGVGFFLGTYLLMRYWPALGGKGTHERNGYARNG